MIPAARGRKPTKYYAKDTPEAVRRRNGYRSLRERMVGGRRAFYRMHKEERQAITETAKQMYDIGADYTTSRAMEEIDRRGFVYVITHPKFTGYVKIGRAFNPESRLRGYQTGCPNREYKLNYAVYFYDCHKAEKVIHDWLSDYNAEGEWFRILPQVAEQVIYELREMNYVG